MDLAEIMARLAEATDAELSAALDGITAEARKVTGSDQASVEQLEKYAGFKAAIQEQQTARTELAARADAARGAFTETADGTDENTAEGEDATEGAADADTTDTNATEGDAADAVTASAKLGAIGKQGKTPPKPKALEQITATTELSGDSAEFATGKKLSDYELAEALAAKWATIARTPGVGRVTVARTKFNYPESRQLSSTDSGKLNTAKIEAVASPEAIVAAGGLCAPLETRYDINVLGVTNRPIRDALSRFGVDRGGIQYRLPMDALAMTTGLGVWTATDDAAVSDPPDGTPAKTCAVIECPGVVTAVVDAIYLCLQYPNFTARFDPEWVAATTRAALVAHARFSENRLLAGLLNGSKRLTSAATVSAVRDVLVTLDHTVAYYRNRHRLDTLSPLRMILPRWVLDLFRADLCRGLGTANLPEFFGVADTTIMGWFRNRGVNVTFHLDGLPAQDIAPVGAGVEDIPRQDYANAAAGSVVPGFPDKIDSVLFAEGDWLFLDGGTLDLGLVRDSTLNAINRYQTFVEAWEGLAFNGIESLRLVMGVQPTGAIVGTLDPVTLALVD